MNPKLLKRIIVFCFVLVPLLSSIISTIHLVDLFSLGNPSAMSYAISVGIEVGAIASFLALSILSRLSKTIVWGMFFILFVMQIIGNVYFSYNYVTLKIAEHPMWLSNFREMMDFFVSDIELKTSKMILSMLIGIPIPLISVFLLKSTTDYLGDDTEKISPSPTIVEEKPEEPAKKDPEPVEAPTAVIEAPQEIPEETHEEQKLEEDEIHITDENESTEESTDPERKRKRVHPARKN